MDTGNSSEWLPPGFAEKIEVRNGKNIKYYYNVTTGVKYHSKKDVIHCATEDFFRDTPQKTTGDDNGESNSKFDAISAKSNKYPSWLPDGWRMEEKIRKNGSSAGSSYKIYINSSTGAKFYSKLAVDRYLKTVDQNNATTEQPKFNNKGEPSLHPDVAVQCKSLLGVDCFPAIDLKRKKSLTVVATDSMPSDGLPPSEAGSSEGKNSKRKKSFTVVDGESTVAYAVRPSEAGRTPGKNSKRKKSFTVVATESTTADGLPPGWVKEIKTSRSGNKIRKDPYYIEPVNGYMFLSKKDALRYLETNDIGSCASMPKRKEVDNLNLNKNEIIPYNVGEPVSKPDTYLQGKSMKDADCSPEKKRSKRSTSMVAAEITSVDGLPPGWIKEMKTRKSGNKIKKDVYYTDPITGHIFRSKNDALRYLETNKSTGPALESTKRESCDSRLRKNERPVENVGLTKKPDMPPQCKYVKDEGCIPEKKEKKKKQILTTVATESTSADGLSPGWIKEIKTSKSGNKIRKDLYYIDPVSGYVFHSKKDVLRYLETNDIASCAIKPKRRKLDNLELTESVIPLDKVGETCLEPEESLHIKSMTSEGCIPEQKKEDKQSRLMIAAASTSVEGLPPGWMKEIRTSRSGNKTRKDLFYTDPISGYVFRSKKDVLRYLETNTINSCAITPKRMELDDQKLLDAKISLENLDETHLKLDVSVKRKSITDVSCITETKEEILQPSSMVVTENASADGLPSGWIKEIKIIQSGDKIRKDPYYTDPVSGYIFRSKKDVFRFLATNDINSCAIKPKKRETNNLQMMKNTNPLDNSAEPHLTPDLSIQSKSMTDASCPTEPKKECQQSSTTVATEIKSGDGLPPGWIKEIKTSKSGDKIRKDVNYTDPVTGYIFRSKKDVLRFLDTKDIGSCAITPKRREADDLELIKNKISPDNSGESFLKSDPSMKCKSTIDAVSVTETKKKSQNPSSAAAAEIASADGLPPGWIKEIKTTHSGDKIRKDPYYVDPVSGYIFRSKKDVLRYLETNDIRSCAIRPKRRETDGPMLNKKKTPSSPSNSKLSKQLETKANLFVGEESITNGGRGSCTKTKTTPKANVFEVASSGADSHKDQYSCANSNNLFDMKSGAEQTKEPSEQGTKAMADVLAICSFINDTFTEEKLPTEIEKPTDGTRSEPRKSQTRRDLNLPLRASKRLAKSEPEMLSDVELGERTLRDLAKKSSATSVPPLFEIDQAKNIADDAFTGEDTLQDEKSVHKVEKPLIENNSALEDETPKKVEKPLAEGNGTLMEQTEGKTNGKQLNEDATSQDTQPCYEFGDSWTDPCLEFAYKTLTGEIPLDDTMPFSEIPYSRDDGGTRTSASEEPTIFESEIPPGFESTNQNNTAEKLPANQSIYLSAVDALFESEIPPGFESVAQNKTVDKSPANPSVSPPQGSTEQGFSDKSS